MKSAGEIRSSFGIFRNGASQRGEYGGGRFSAARTRSSPRARWATSNPAKRSPAPSGPNLAAAARRCASRPAGRDRFDRAIRRVAERAAGHDHAPRSEARGGGAQAFGGARGNPRQKLELKLVRRCDRGRRNKPVAKAVDHARRDEDARALAPDDRIADVEQGRIARPGADDEIGDDGAVFGRAEIAGEDGRRRLDKPALFESLDKSATSGASSARPRIVG